MSRLVVAAAIILAAPGALGVLGAATLLCLVKLNLHSNLANLGAVGVAMSYIVPFTLVLSGVAVGVSFWLAITMRTSAQFIPYVRLFLVVLLISCAHVAIMTLFPSDAPGRPH